MQRKFFFLKISIYEYNLLVISNRKNLRRILFSSSHIPETFEVKALFSKVVLGRMLGMTEFQTRAWNSKHASITYTGQN